MRIHHVALWTADLDRAVGFWKGLFGIDAGDLYESARRPGFVSRFLALAPDQSIEIMQAPWLEAACAGERVGYAHVALSAGSPGAVDALADRAREAGCLNAAPRWTGDGFYEAVVVDPDGNLIEVTA